MCALNLETFNISRKIYHLNEAFGTTQCSSSVLCIYILYVKIYSTPRTADDSQVINLYRAKIAFKKDVGFFYGSKMSTLSKNTNHGAPHFSDSSFMEVLSWDLSPVKPSASLSTISTFSWSQAMPDTLT